MVAQKMYRPQNVSRGSGLIWGSLQPYLSSKAQVRIASPPKADVTGRKFGASAKTNRHGMVPSTISQAICLNWGLCEPKPRGMPAGG